MNKLIRETLIRQSRTLIGRQASFTYPNYGTPNSHPDYTAHSKQMVTIVDVDPFKDAPIYHIQAEDGWKGMAWRDELRVKKNKTIKTTVKV